MKPFALGGAFAIIDLVLHPLFHIWVAINPESYERIMNLFVAGLKLEVTEFDTNFWHITLGTLLEAIAFFVLGYLVAIIYNQLSKQS